MMFTVLLLLRRQQHLIREMERTSQCVLRKWAAIIIDTATVPADTASLFRTTPSEAQEMRLKEVWKLSESNPTGIWQDLRTGTAESDTNTEKLRDYVTFAEGACLQAEWVTDPCVNMFIAILRDRVQDAASPALATSFFSVKAAELASPTEITDKEVILQKVMMYLRNSNSKMVELSSVSSLLIPINLPGVHWGVLQVGSGWMTLFDGSMLKDASAKWGICVSVIDNFLALSPLPSLLCDWKCKGTQISASSLTLLLADASTPGNWSFGEEIVDKLRAEVVDQLQIRCTTNKDCETILSLEYFLDVNLQRAAGQNAAGQDAVISEAHTDNAYSYLVAMSTAFTWGGFPEIQELSDMLARPIIVFDHPVAGQFKLSCHVNSSANALPLFLLRSNVRNERATHFQLMIPVVAFKDLFDAAGYGPMLRAALSIVVVHPARITVSDGSGQSTEFFVFGSQGDGNCLFRAIALFKLAIGLCTTRADQEGNSFWSRQLPSIEVDLAKTATDVERLWRSTAEIRNCAWSGKAVFDDSTVGGIMRHTRLMFLHCPSVADAKSVHLDAGHGLGVVQLAIAVGSKRTAIGVEQDSELHCFAKECNLYMLQRGGQMGKVAFRCADLADFVLDGVHVVHMYESMAGNVQGDNDAHMALVERLLQTPSVHIFTSTKLQSSLLKEYRNVSTIIDEELTHSWVVVKVDGPRRRGNNPGSFVFMRWSGVLEGINFGEFEMTTSKSPVAELVQAAYQRSVGAVWSLRLELSSNSKTSGEGYGGVTLNFLFGVFELDCHLTGLKLVTGCAVIGRGVAPRAHWLIGFATTPALPGFAPCTKVPVFLVLKNDSMLAQDQFVIIRQVDLIAVGASTDAKLFQVNDFRHAKEHFKATAMSKRPPSSRISQNANKLQPPKIEVAKALPVSDNELNSTHSKTKQQLQLEKQMQKPDPEAKPSDKSKQQLQQLKEQKEQLKEQTEQLKDQNTLQKAKIKSLQQAARRNRLKPVTSPSDGSGHDSDTFSSEHEYASANKKHKSGTDNKDKNDTETKPKKNGDAKELGPVEAKPKKNGDAKELELVETKPKKNGDAKELGPVGPEQNGVSTAALEERIAKQTRTISQTMQQQQDMLVALIQKTHDNEKLKRDDVNKEEKERVEGKRFETLHSEVRDLKSLLMEQEKASELKSLRQTNEMLAQTLKDRDKSDTAGRSSVLNNLKEAKELMSLFQGGSSSQTGGHASQTGGHASQTGGNGNNHESSAAGAWSTGHGYPSNGHTAWHAGYAGHSPQWPGHHGYPPWADQWPSLQSSWQQWPTGHPPQSPSHQPSWQQWPTGNGYTPQPQTVHAGQSQSHQPPWPSGHPPQSPSHQPSWQQWPVHAGQSPSHQSPWPTSTGYPPQPPSHQPHAGQPPSYQPGPEVERSGKQYPTSESDRSGRSRSPRSKKSSVSSSAVQYSRSEIELWDGKNVQRWLHNSGIGNIDAATLTGRNGILQDGYYLLSLTHAEFIAQFPSHRSADLPLRVLWTKIDAMQQAR
jgi:hypothetical protein